jgi:hypothetical protein
VTPSVHFPLIAGQVAALAHTAFGGLLQLPGQSVSTRHTAPPFLQLPEAGQSESFLHD